MNNKHHGSDCTISRYSRPGIDPRFGTGGNLGVLPLLACLLLSALLEPASVAMAADTASLGNTAAAVATTARLIPAAIDPAAIGHLAIAHQLPADFSLAEPVTGDRQPSPPETSAQIRLRDLWTHHRVGVIALSGATVVIALLLFGLSLRNRQLSQAHRAAAESEMRFRATFDQAAIGIAHVAPDGRWLRVNRRLCEIVGYSHEELQAGYFNDITHPDDIDANSVLRQRCLTGEIDEFHVEQRYLRKDGSPRWVDITVALVRRDNADPAYFIAVIDDIDQRRRDQAALEEANALYQGLIENMNEGVAIYHAVDDGEDFVCKALNPAGARSARHSAGAVVGRRVREVFPGIDAMGLLDLFKQVYRSGQSASHQITNYRDERVSFWVKNHVFKLPGGELVAIFTDVSEQKTAEDALLQSQAKLKRMAYYDVLTGLPNRRMLLDRLRQATAVADRNGSLVAVCYLDLDEFKPVNDRLGHATGDALLRAVAERLGSIIRTGDTASRWGGDEFALLLTGLNNAQECEQTVARLLRLLATPYRIDAEELKLSASIGVALYPLDKSDSDALLRHADHAMYIAKQRGRNGFHVFDPAADDPRIAKLGLTLRIGEALSNDELRLLYQPIVDMRSGRVDSIEALVRWQHPERGLLPPRDFLPLIEGGDLIRQLDMWVLAHALDDLAGWIERGLSLTLSVNISYHSLVGVGFIERVKDILDAHPSVRADQIGLEILETAALGDLETVTQVIRQGSDMGLRFALDDFGTGQSSLTYFRDLPTQVLKIDQSFVRDMLHDKADLRVVEAVIGLSQAFNRTVVGEGVETEAHGMMLLRFGCELGQGYGIARPMPPEEVVAWLESYRQPHEWRSVEVGTWRRDDFPLLTMEAEHRDWVTSVLRRSRRETDIDPELLDADHCRFGRWYAGEGRLQYGHRSLFKDLDPLHQRVHEIASELLLTSDGQPDEALLEQFYNASNRFLDHLTMLQNALIDNTLDHGARQLPE